MTKQEFINKYYAAAVAATAGTGLFAETLLTQLIGESGYNLSELATKFFNFFKNAQRARLSKVDFYMDVTDAGQLTCDVLADSSDVPVNTPLSDNPQSNIVLTTLNPYQVGGGPETIYRLFCDAQAQTIQLSLFLTDEQMAVNSISQSNFQLLNMVMSVRPGGRLI